MKTHLLDFLNHQNQHLLLQQLSPSDINSLFDYYDNLIILKSLIKTFEPDRLSKLLQRLYKTNKDKFANPYVAAESGYVDDVIFPDETRLRLENCLEILETKVDSNPKKKHGNIPL